MGFRRCVMPEANIDPADRRPPPATASWSASGRSAKRSTSCSPERGSRSAIHRDPAVIWLPEPGRRVVHLVSRRLRVIPGVASWPGLRSRACSSSPRSRTRRRCFGRFRSALPVNVGFALVLAGARRRCSRAGCARPRVTRVLGALIGCAIGLGIARAIGAGLFWADTGDRRVEFLHSFILIVLPYLGPGARRQARRVARAGAARQPVPRGRPAAPLQDPRHQRHHRRPHRRRLRDRLRRRHARHPAVRAEGAAARRRLGRLAQAQPRPARPRHPAEDSEDGGRRGHDLGRRLSRTSAKSI